MANLVMMIYLDTMLWNELCDQNVDAAASFPRLQRGKRSGAWSRSNVRDGSDVQIQT